MGSSAGGHLGACASTLFDLADGRTGAALDNSVSARPDFAVLVYPVITMTDPAAHAGSRRALLGAEPSSALLALMSVEQQVTAATPPLLPSPSAGRQAQHLISAKAWPRGRSTENAGRTVPVPCLTTNSHSPVSKACC